jgi:hypothetical protein
MFGHERRGHLSVDQQDYAKAAQHKLDVGTAAPGGVAHLRGRAISLSVGKANDSNKEPDTSEKNYRLPKLRAVRAVAVAEAARLFHARSGRFRGVL